MHDPPNRHTLYYTLCHRSRQIRQDIYLFYEKPRILQVNTRLTSLRGSNLDTIPGLRKLGAELRYVRKKRYCHSEITARIVA